MDALGYDLHCARCIDKARLQSIVPHTHRELVLTLASTTTALSALHTMDSSSHNTIECISRPTSTAQTLHRTRPLLRTSTFPTRLISFKNTISTHGSQLTALNSYSLLHLSFLLAQETGRACVGMVGVADFHWMCFFFAHLFSPYRKIKL